MKPWRYVIRADHDHFTVVSVNVQRRYETVKYVNVLIRLDAICQLLCYRLYYNWINLLIGRICVIIYA